MIRFCQFFFDTSFTEAVGVVLADGIVTSGTVVWSPWSPLLAFVGMPDRVDATVGALCMAVHALPGLSLLLGGHPGHQGVSR